VVAIGFEDDVALTHRHRSPPGRQVRL
jgi:hypothetical protein